MAKCKECDGRGQIGHVVDISEYCPCPFCFNGEVHEPLSNRKFVAVHFPNSDQRYDFFTVLNLEKGDKVVVNTINGFAIAIVRCMLPKSKYANNWVVQKVDVEGFEQFKEDFKHAKQTKKRRERIGLSNTPESNLGKDW